jgi:predicted membrane protein
VVRVLMATTLPVGVVPTLGGALWPVTFVLLQVVTTVYFARAGFWRILITGTDPGR